MVKRKHLFWAAPLALVLILAVLLLALPDFVAAPSHRAAMEDFASRLTGREVKISGKLSLSYLPEPEITASGITITGPGHETITAKSLSLALAMPALLHGQLAVRTLNLDTPVISYPWPLPGGISAVAPPPWLAALHAHLDNGRIRFGAVDFTNVNADIFTGAGGSVSVSGNGSLAQRAVSLSLAVGETAANGSAQISIQSQLGDAKTSLSGTLDEQSHLAGQLSLQMPDGLNGSAQISADANGISASGISLSQDTAQLNGTAEFSFTPLELRAELTGQNIDFTKAKAATSLWPAQLPVQINLSAGNIKLAGRAYPSLQMKLENAAGQLTLRDLALGLPGGASLGGSISRSASHALTGHLSLSAPDLAATTAGLGLPGESAWSSASLQAELGGTSSAPVLNTLSGQLGADHVSGHVILSRADSHAAYQLSFDHLALAPLAAWLGQKPLGGHFTAEGELSAAQADAGPVKLSNLFVDSEMDGTLNIRRATANLYNGVAGASVTLDGSFKVTSAHGFLDVPSATPFAGMLPASLKLPRELLAPRLSMLAAAAGPPDALSASFVGRLGDFTVTASPLINLIKLSAAGAVSLQHPSAIAALKLLGLTQGNGCTRLAAGPDEPDYPFQKTGALPCAASATDPGMAFPGPGSLSLRARFSAAAEQYGLNDFVLSAGQLSASGQLMEAQGKLSGQIASSMLALPPLPASLQMPGSLPLSGGISVNAEQVLYAGTQILGPSAATLSFAPDHASLKLSQASIGNGNLSGNADLQLSAKSAPALSAKLLAEGVDASTLSLPQSFPLTLSAGQISATASLTASGYTPKAWEATLGGSGTITASNGVLNGISLPDLQTALAAPRKTGLAKALTSGATPFTSLTLAGKLSQGNSTLNQAQLTSPAGTLNASGDIDLFDSSLALKLNAAPAVTPPLSLSTTLIGPWASPSRTNQLQAAQGWKPAPPVPAPAASPPAAPPPGQRPAASAPTPTPAPLPNVIGPKSQ